jgi:hypothetical protein
MKKTDRKAMHEVQKKHQARRRILIFGGWSLAIIALIAVIFFVVNNSAKSVELMGDEVAIPSRDHVPTDTPPGPYKSNPPAGGAHYATDFPAKFYQETDLTTLPKNPQGYLVHSLEHGYVIFWYNCQVPNTDCAALKQTIQKVMDETGGIKLIAFPWTDMDIPLAMTSWGRILKFPSPDPVLMKQFVERNRYQAPEPDAP